MAKSLEGFEQRLLLISTELQEQMVVLRAIRETVRTAEAARCIQELPHPAVVAPPPSNEMRI